MFKEHKRKPWHVTVQARQEETGLDLLTPASSVNYLSRSNWTKEGDQISLLTF